MKAFIQVKLASGEKVNVPNTEVQLTTERDLRTQVLSAWPTAVRFSCCVLRDTADQVLELPSWFEKIGGKLSFNAGDKPKAPSRKLFRVKKGFVWEGEKFVRGQTLRLLPNDPRIADWQEKGRLCK